MIFARPNGSGKTSLIDDMRQSGLATLRGVYPVP
jgi:predicted ATPase